MVYGDVRAGGMACAALLELLGGVSTVSDASFLCSVISHALSHFLNCVCCGCVCVCVCGVCLTNIEKGIDSAYLNSKHLVVHLTTKKPVNLQRDN